MARTARPVLAPLVLSGGTLLGLYLLAVCTVRGQSIENAVVHGSDLAHGDPDWAQSMLAHIADERSLLVMLILLLGLAWRRRMMTTGFVVAATMLAANLTSQLLKGLVLVRPEWVMDAAVGTRNSLPSGTVTFLLSSALALVFLLPRTGWWRPASMGLAVLAVVGGCATIALDWHRPADVVAGVIVVIAWFAVALAYLDRRLERTGDRVRDWRPLTAGCAGMAAGCLGPLLAIVCSPHVAPSPDGGVYVAAMGIVASTGVHAVLGMIRCLDPDRSNYSPAAATPTSKTSVNVSGRVLQASSGSSWS